MITVQNPDLVRKIKQDAQNKLESINNQYNEIYNELKNTPWFRFIKRNKLSNKLDKLFSDKYNKYQHQYIICRRITNSNLPSLTIYNTTQVNSLDNDIVTKMWENKFGEDSLKEDSF